MKTKKFVGELKDRIRNNTKPTNRTRIHHAIEVFSTLNYKGDLANRVDEETIASQPQDSDGQPLAETKEAMTRRRLAIYRRVIQEAWTGASDEQKAEVERVLEEERAAAAVRKAAEQEAELDNEDDDQTRSPEDYSE